MHPLSDTASVHVRRGSVEDFCARRGIGRSLFYKHIDKMPRVTKIGKRTLILEEDERAWVESEALKLPA